MPKQNEELLPPQGTMSRVYYSTIELPDGKGTCSHHRVVVKRPPADGEYGEFIKHEFDIMKTLHHPNIMRPLAWFNDGDHIGYVMEVINGGNLGQVLQQMPKDHFIPEEFIGDLMIGLVPTLAYIHSLRIAHGDIKTANVLVNIEKGRRDGMKYVPILSDFGASGEISGVSKEVEVEPNLERRPKDVESLGMILSNIVEDGIWQTQDYGNNGVDAPTISEAYNAQLDDFVKKLTTDLKQLPTMNDMLNHPWLVTQFQKRNMLVPGPFPYPPMV